MTHSQTAFEWNFNQLSVAVVSLALGVFFIYLFTVRGERIVLLCCQFELQQAVVAVALVRLLKSDALSFVLL